MKKFLSYSLGVLALLHSSIVDAIEKFEVLPDLPEALSYAVQPVEASTISTIGDASSVGHEPSIISVILSLAFVVLLIYLTGILYAKLNKVGFNTMKRQQGDFTKSHVSVVSTTQLGNNKTLHVVELDGKRMLIGASNSAIQLIKDLGTNTEDETCEDFSRIEIPNITIPKIEIPKIEIPSINFSKMVTKAHKNWLKEENNSVLNNIEEKDIIEDVLDEEPTKKNSEEIIDSLFITQPGNEIDIQEPVSEKNEHIVDPDEYALYKKYLG